MNYYDEIKEKLIKCEIYDRVKDYSKERNRVEVYYEIGKLLSEAGKEYGKNIIKQYSEGLVNEVGKKYNITTLMRMRQLYYMFSDEKVAPSAQQLTWSHYIELMPIKDKSKRKYYLNICIKENLSRNNLRQRIKSHEYERLSDKTKIKLTTKAELKITDLVPHPIYIKTDKINEELNEYALKQLILNNIDNFLEQLGQGFTYVGNEYRIKIDDKYNYIDILLFNYKYNCFVVIELKTIELKKEHIGQIEIYMNYVDRHIKNISHDKTIGIIITRKENKYVIEYCSDKRIYNTNYELVQ